MDFPGIPEICLILIIVYVLLTFYVKKKTMSYYLTYMADSLPWILINVYRFHDMSLGFLGRNNGTYFANGKWLGASEFLATADPANVHYIATTNFSNYPKGDEYRKAFDVMGYALFNSDDDDWKQYRRLIHTPIKSRKFLNYSIKTAHANLNQILVPLLKHASQHSDRVVLDLQDVFQRFALDVTCKSLTGHDPKSLAIDLPKMPFLEAMADFETGIIYRIAFPELLWKVQLFLGFGPENRLNLARKIINNYISSIVFKKRDDVLTKNRNIINEDEGVDFLELLMKDVMKDGVTQITHINDDVFFQDITMQQLVAGRDTISSAMTWFSWLMTTHGKVEEKIRDEIRVTIHGAQAEEGLRVFNSNETSNLVYLHAALLESMRLYPPAPFQYKTPRQPDTLPTGHPVNPKTKILIALYAMGRMKSIWGENCCEFEPERWISDQGTIKHEPSNKYLVFYTGPRSCMGKDAALTQMKMVAATLIHNFRFELVKGQKIKPDVSMILHVKHGLKVKVHNRWTS